MSKSTEPFRKAILTSLNQLIENEAKISAASVIKNAKFEDGRRVGKSSLYKKNSDRTKNIHEDLILLIEEAKNNYIKKGGKQTRQDTIESYKEQVKSLKSKLSDLVDQMVEQEARCKRVDTRVNSNMQSLSVLEEELYLIYSILIELVPKDSKVGEQANNFINKYEIKSTSIESIHSAKSAVKGYIKDIRDSTLIRI